MMLYASSLLRFLHLTIAFPYQGLFPVRLYTSDVKDQWATPLPKKPEGKVPIRVFGLFCENYRNRTCIFSLGN